MVAENTEEYLATLLAVLLLLAPFQCAVFRRRHPRARNRLGAASSGGDRCRRPLP